MNKPNRLSRLVHQPGGLSMREAVSAADANLGVIRPEMVAQVGVIMERMQAIGRTSQIESDVKLLAELYALANSAVGLAGVFGMGILGQVSYSLCDLLDRMQERGWNGPAFRVHMESLAFMHGETPGQEASGDQQRVLAALRQLVDRL